jgi:hypothetical protein
MISSPTIRIASRGQELQKPRDDQYGVLNRFLWSIGSGRRTKIPSDCKSAMKPSSSRWAGSTMNFG